MRRSSTYSGSSMSVPVTRFSLRMYGSQKAVEQEQKRQEREGKYVVHPYSNFRFYWDLITLLLLITSMLTIPICITFFNTEITTDVGWIIFNLSLDVWFLCDIIMNFQTGIITDSGEGEVILDLNTIRRRYVKSWFFIDLISTLPLDYIIQVIQGSATAQSSASRAMKLVRFAKILSLLRLLRISRLIRYVHQWEQIVGMQYDLAVAAVRIFNLVCLMLLIGHWNGCLQFLVPMLNGFPSNSWVVTDGLRNQSWGVQYSWCLFKAMSHMLCIGYGQQPPQNLVDLWMTMLSMVSGAVCFAMFIGNATALIQSMDSSKRQYKEKYMQVKEYMRYRRLPKQLRSRVYQYYENRYQGKMFDEMGILNELSASLREQIVNFNCRHLVGAVTFFKNADPDFVSEVVQKLRFEVFQADDLIVKEGEVGKKMYFLQHGKVEVRKKGADNPIKLLFDGSYFGEICLLSKGKRVASVHAITYCSTYSLHVDDFNSILSRNPVMRQTLENVAAARLKTLGDGKEVANEIVKETKEEYSEAKDFASEIVRHDEFVPPEQPPSASLYRRSPCRSKTSSLINDIKKRKISESDTNSMLLTPGTTKRTEKYFMKRMQDCEKSDEEITELPQSASFTKSQINISSVFSQNRKCNDGGRFKTKSKSFSFSKNFAKKRGSLANSMINAFNLKAIKTSSNIKRKNSSVITTQNHCNYNNSVVVNIERSSTDEDVDSLANNSSSLTRRRSCVDMSEVNGCTSNGSTVATTTSLMDEHVDSNGAVLLLPIRRNKETLNCNLLSVESRFEGD